MKKSAFITFLIMCCSSALPAQGFLWARGMGGSSMDRAYGVTLDPQGNVYTTGHFSGTVDFDPGAGVFNLTATAGRDIFISKLDAAGNFVWAKGIGGAYASISIASDEGCAIAVDDFGCVYATGSFSGTADFDPGPGSFILTSASALTRDLFLLKLDWNGNFVWAKRIGGKGEDVGESLAIDKRGSVYLTGFFQDTVDFDPGVAQYTIGAAYIETPFILKIDTWGTFRWARALMPSTGDPYGLGEGRSIAWDKTESLSLTGWYRGALDFDPGPGSYTMTSTAQQLAIPSVDIFVMKVDTGGNFVWAKSMGSDNFFPECGKSISADSLGSVYVTGFYTDTVDFDPGPATFTLASANWMAHGFVLKLDALGNFGWARNTGATISPTLTGSSVGNDIATDVAGNVFVSGSFAGTIDFDPGPSSFTMASRNVGNSSSANAFLSKFDAAGNFVWAWNMAATVAYDANDRNAIALDAQGGIYMAGHFSDTCDFDPGTGTYTLSAAGGYDIFVTRLGQTFTNTALPELQQAQGLAVYPNPAGSVVTVKWDEPTTGLNYTIIDQLGRPVAGGTIREPLTQVDLSHLANGLYFIKAGEGNARPVRLVKQ